MFSEIVPTTRASHPLVKPLRARHSSSFRSVSATGTPTFVHDGDGDFSLLGARALEACARAEVEFVIYSGRRRSTLWHDARILGVHS